MIRFEYELDGFLQVFAGLIECRALCVGSRKLFDKGRVALRNLDEYGGPVGHWSMDS